MRSPMGKTLRILFPCALGLVAALLVSCGDTSNLIPGTDADAINKNVDAAAAASASGRCGRASSAVDRAEQHVQQLPSKVDPRLKANLEQGLQTLRVTAASECTQNQTTATTESTQSTETTATTESTASTETTNTQTQPTQTQPTQTQPTQTSGGGGNNGSGGGGGGGGTGAPPGSGGGTQAP
jgi:hypothetical protein